MTNDESRNDEFAEFHRLVNEIEIAMLTTRREDGHLVSRPMATQNWLAGADLWFATSRDAEMLDEIGRDPHVNVAYYRDGTREWLSVSGQAFASDDRDTIRRLWRHDWKTWFPDRGGAENGSADDPRIVLIGIRAHTAAFMTAVGSRPRVLFDVAKAAVQGTRPHLGDVHHLDDDDFAQRAERDRHAGGFDDSSLSGP